MHNVDELPLSMLEDIPFTKFVFQTMLRKQWEKWNCILSANNYTVLIAYQSGSYNRLSFRQQVCALWSPAGEGMTSWLSFVMSNCEFFTFPLVSWVRCGTWLYRFLIFAPLLTFYKKPVRRAEAVHAIWILITYADSEEAVLAIWVLITYADSKSSVEQRQFLRFGYWLHMQTAKALSGRGSSCDLDTDYICRQRKLRRAEVVHAIWVLITHADSESSVEQR